MPSADTMDRIRLLQAWYVYSHHARFEIYVTNALIYVFFISFDPIRIQEESKGRKRSREHKQKKHTEERRSEKEKGECGFITTFFFCLYKISKY